ncbi:hypothetical protein [Nocardia sp. NPDC051832]|uniref:hypothetical protein n=1 Tax=Nocardia sp. NPDC051832 TaxID=3155673 RepID=UPI00343AEE89
MISDADLRQSSSTAYAAATLAVLGGLAMMFGAFMAYAESANTKPYEQQRADTLDLIVFAFGFAGLFLLAGAFLCYAGSYVGRALIVLGSGFAVAGHIVGFILMAFVMNPGYSVSHSVRPAGFVFFLVLLACPSVTLWCALTRSTGLWLAAQNRQ